MNNGYQNMGRGSVMQRPLFRQEGGPAEPSMEEMAAMGQQYLMQPPPPAAPAGNPQESMAMLQQGEAAGREQGQMMGEMYGQATMEGLDAAEDPKSLIDAIRGTSLPIEERYTELAGLVGEEDAQKTPESVLALVQPTIMMTEEGAMDSGIGELMKGLVGEADMSEDSAMSQGVGELMAMGAGSTPPVNFRNGGPVEVRGYQDGTEVRPGGGSRIINQAEKNVSQYEDYFAGGFDQQARAAALQEQREMSQAQMLFDIAGTALNFAGQTQGGSIAERLANAASQTQLTDKIGTRAAGMLSAKQAQAAEDRQLRMAARDASLGQSQTDEQNRQELLLAGARSSKTAPDMKTIYTVDGDGNPKIFQQFNMKVDADVTAYRALIDEDNQAKLDFKIYDDETIKPFIQANQARLTGDIEGQKTLSTEYIVKQPFSVTRNGVKVDFKAGELGFFTQNELNKHASSLGSIASGTERVTLYPVSGKGNPVSFPKTSSQIAALTGLDGGYTDNPAAYVSRLDEDKAKRQSELEFKPVDFYITNSEGKTTIQTINTSGEQGLKDSKALLALGYVTDPTRSKAEIAEEFAKRQEERGFNAVPFYRVNKDGSTDSAVLNVATAEGRNEATDLFKDGYTTDNAEASAALAETYGIRQEGRNEEKTIRAEIRSQRYLKYAEVRANDRTLSKEKRDFAALLLKEGRAEITLIAAETRANDRTLTSEERALARKKAEETRGELIAVRAKQRDVRVDIAAEKRALAAAEAKEGRDAVAPFTKTINDKLYRIDLSQPEDKRITLLLDGSTLPDVFGSGTTGKIISIASNEELLSKYANNTLDKEEDGISVTEMEAALSGYTLPTDVSYNTSTKERTSTPGRPLNQSQILALQARKAAGYSVPTGIIFPADDIEAQVTNILSEQDSNVGTAPLAEFLTDDAWGSAGFFKNLANIGIEAASFGIAPAYFTDAKNANDAIKNLNQEFETLFMASSEIRDSVFQGKKIEDLTPDPSKPFQGPDASQSKALNIYLRLTRQIERIQQSIIDPSVFQKETGSGSVGEKRQMLPVLMDLAAGYALLAKVDVGIRGIDPQSIEQTQRENSLLDELDAASGLVKKK